MLRALQDRLARGRGERSVERSRSRSRSRRRSLDFVSPFPMTERSPLERQPTMREGRPTGTGYQPPSLCPTCVRTHWTWVASEFGVIPSDAPDPVYSRDHNHTGPYGPVTPVGYVSTPFESGKQCGAYFDIPVEPVPDVGRTAPPTSAAAEARRGRFEFKAGPPTPRSALRKGAGDQAHPRPRDGSPRQGPPR